MRVAIVHDWITGMRGGEKCLEAFLKLYPTADVYTLLHKKGTTSELIDNAIVGTSFLQRIPNIEKYYRYFLPLFPLAVRSLKLDGYQLVISTSHAAAKNVKTPEDTFHVSYCFTPMRYIWDQSQTYLGKKSWLTQPLLKMLREWDTAGSKGVDDFIAISKLVSARIRAYYGRRATVIYPPVETGWIKPITKWQKGEAFLYAGALVPYKRVDLIITAFNQLKIPLIVAGSGPEENRLRALSNSNIKFLGRVSDAELAELYRNCRALIFPGKEDFGMIPVEVQSAGRPVIALESGGARETVHGIMHNSIVNLAEFKPTGVFFKADKQNSTSELISAVNYFIRHEEEFLPEYCYKQSQLFQPIRFAESWCEFVSKHGFPAPIIPSEWKVPNSKSQGQQVLNA